MLSDSTLSQIRRNNNNRGGGGDGGGGGHGGHPRSPEEVIEGIIQKRRFFIGALVVSIVIFILFIIYVVYWYITKPTDFNIVAGVLGPVSFLTIVLSSWVLSSWKADDQQIAFSQEQILSKSAYKRNKAAEDTKAAAEEKRKLEEAKKATTPPLPPSNLTVK